MESAFDAPSALFPVFAQVDSLVVLTQDTELLGILHTVAATKPVSPVPDEVGLASRLMSGQGGITLIDAAAVASPIGELTSRLKTQFPDLILVVTGSAQEQAALNTQIGNGQVYRFLHKPLSEQRVKLSIEAAWRRHGEIMAGITNAATSRAIPALQSRRSLKALGIGAGALTTIVCGGLYFSLTPKKATPPHQTAAATPSVAIQRWVPEKVQASPSTLQVAPPGEKLAPAASKTKPTAPPLASAQSAPPQPSSGQGGAIGTVAESAPVLPEPFDEEAENRQLQMIGQLMGEARKAYSTDNLEEGDRWAQAAHDAGASEDNLKALEREAQRVRLARSAATQARTALADAQSAKVKADSIAAVEKQIADLRIASPVPRVKIRHVEPDFPAEARRRHASGWVDLDLAIKADGSVSDVAVLGSTPAGLFDKAAVTAARSWRYEPLELESAPPEQHDKVRIRFQLD